VSGKVAVKRAAALNSFKQFIVISIVFSDRPLTNPSPRRSFRHLWSRLRERTTVSPLLLKSLRMDPEPRLRKIYFPAYFFSAARAALM
jgi:hypothetical protein